VHEKIIIDLICHYAQVTGTVFSRQKEKGVMKQVKQVGKVEGVFGPPPVS